MKVRMLALFTLLTVGLAHGPASAAIIIIKAKPKPTGTSDSTTGDGESADETPTLQSQDSAPVTGPTLGDDGPGVRVRTAGTPRPDGEGEGSEAGGAAPPVTGGGAPAISLRADGLSVGAVDGADFDEPEEDFEGGCGGEPDPGAAAGSLLFVALVGGLRRWRRKRRI